MNENDWNQTKVRTSGGILNPRVGYDQTAATPTDQSPSQVRDAISMAEQQTEALHAALSHLESRLDTILTPQPPTVQGGATPSQPSVSKSHTTERLANLNRGIMDAVTRIRDLSQRVEL